MTALDVDAFQSAIGIRPDGDEISELRRRWPMSPDRIRSAFEAAGVILDDYQALKATALVGEQLVVAADRLAAIDLRRLGLLLMPAAAEAALADSEEPGLHVCPELADRLPLVSLATDIARSQPDSRLVVRLEPLRGCFGLYLRRSRSGKGSIIVLSDRLGRLADRIVEFGGRPEDAFLNVFAHELSHAVDPEFGTVDSIGSEAFAVELGATIEVVLPESLEELAPMVDAALALTHSKRRPVAASGSLAGILEWTALEVGAVSARPVGVAA